MSLFMVAYFLSYGTLCQFYGCGAPFLWSTMPHYGGGDPSLRRNMPLFLVPCFLFYGALWHYSWCRSSFPMADYVTFYGARRSDRH